MAQGLSTQADLEKLQICVTKQEALKIFYCTRREDKILQLGKWVEAASNHLSICEKQTNLLNKNAR